MIRNWIFFTILVVTLFPDIEGNGLFYEDEGPGVPCEDEDFCCTLDLSCKYVGPQEYCDSVHAGSTGKCENGYTGATYNFKSVEIPANCPTVTVSSIDHWKDGETGMYFNLSEEDFGKMVGEEDRNRKNIAVVQVQDGLQSWKGDVVVYKHPMGADGRRVNGPGDGQWKKGDIIVLQECLEAASTVTIDCSSPFNEVTTTGTAITSPNYPSNYNNGNDCQVTIRFAAEQIVSITLESFDVESHSSCGWDYLAIHDGDSTNSPFIGSKLCGSSHSGTTIQSTGNSMTLHFHTDGSVTRPGFKVYANSETAPPTTTPGPTVSTSSGDSS